MLNLFVLDYHFLLISFLIGIYFYLIKDYDFFKKKHIPYEKPYPIFGSMAKVFLQKMNGYEYSERQVFYFTKNFIKPFMWPPRYLIRILNFIKIG